MGGWSEILGRIMIIDVRFLYNNSHKLYLVYINYMGSANLPDWIRIPKGYELVNYSKRWYELMSSSFLRIYFGKFPDLGSGYKVEKLKWGKSDYRIYKISTTPIKSIPDYQPTFIRIPGRKFLMDEFNLTEERRDPTNKKSINLTNYWICKKPITIKQFSYFINYFGYKTKEEIYRKDSYIWSHPNGNVEEIELNPNTQVQYVGIEDINVYCDWLREITGNKYRLPHLAEWENAFNNNRYFQQGEWAEWTSDFEDVSLGYDPECTGEPIYYKTKRMYRICGGTKSLTQRNVSFGPGRIGFRLIMEKQA